jgi:hypothetical protein
MEMATSRDEGNVVDRRAALIEHDPAIDPV